MKSLFYQVLLLSLIAVNAISLGKTTELENEEDDEFWDDFSEVKNPEDVDSEDDEMSDETPGGDDEDEMMGDNEKQKEKEKSVAGEGEVGAKGTTASVEKSKIQGGLKIGVKIRETTKGDDNKGDKREKAAEKSDGEGLGEAFKKVEKRNTTKKEAPKVVEDAKQGSETADEASGEGEESGYAGDILGEVVQMSDDVGSESADSEGSGSADSEGSGSGNIGDVRPDKDKKAGKVDAKVAQTSDEKEREETRTKSALHTDVKSEEADSGSGTTKENTQDTSKDIKEASAGNGQKLKDIQGLSETGATGASLKQYDGKYLLASGNKEDSKSDKGGEFLGSAKNKATTTPKKDPSDTVKNQNVKDLLRDLVPTGILPNVPEGFTKLSAMSTISFTYKVDENNEVTVTSDIKEPLELFKGKITLTDTKMTFNYKDKEKKGQAWRFDVQAKWMNGQQVFDVTLENSKHDDHFTLTGEGETLALEDYASIFVPQKAFVDSGIDVNLLKRTALSDAEIYIVFKDDANLVSLVSGKAEISAGKSSLLKTYIQKFPEEDAIFSIFVDFQDTTPLSVLSSTMAGKLSDIPFVKQLLRNKALLRIDNGAFGFVASSADVDKLRLTVFGEGVLEKQLGAHISAGVTLMLPVLIHSQDAVEKHNMAVRISRESVRFFPTQGNPLDVAKAFKTLSEFTRPKITALGYPDVSRVTVTELAYDLDKLTFTILGHVQSPFNVIPGMLSLVDSTLEFRQLVPDEFATLALYGDGKSNVGAARFNVSVHTDTATGELVLEGKAHELWSADIGQEFGVAMEMDAETRGVLGDNHMLNVNIENAHMFAVMKDEVSDKMHFYGFSRPAMWNDAIEVEAVVYHDVDENKKRITMAYVFDKLPLTYAIDALSSGQFPSPKLLDNSRHSTLVWSPSNADSAFLNPAMNGLSFMRGLSLVGQFRLPDVCSLNTECEAAAQLLGTENWYQVQGLVSPRGYTLAGYVDKAFTLAKGLTLKDNVVEFALGNYSYMSISTALYLDKNNLTFRGYLNFDTNGVRLRMSSNDLWSRPFPASFVAFDRLQIDVPFVSGIPMDELLITGELNFGLPGSLYRIFAPAYLTYKPSTPDKVSFQATLAGVTMETIVNALNFKSTLPEVLRNSRFPDPIVASYTPDKGKTQQLELYGKLTVLQRTLICKLHIDDMRRITATTSHSKYPLMLDNGLVVVYANKNQTKLGPRIVFTMSSGKTTFKLTGYATFMGLGTKTEIDVSESGTEFSLNGNLFGLTKTVVSIMSPEGLPENGPYLASACIPEVIPQVVSRVDALVTSAADHAQGYAKQAAKNFQQAIIYHNDALVKEQKNKEMLNEMESNIEMDDSDLFVAEARFNGTCKEQECDKTCIGCTAWQKCCDHDVFGNCVRCPGWKACCWRGINPICTAKNQGCRIMNQWAADNLQSIARRVFKDKEKKTKSDETLWQSEYLKGKTQAILDAARRALSLVNHDSRVGLDAAASIKRFGLQRLVNIQSVCFQTSLKTLATSCVGMRINATFADQEGTTSIPYYGCLNKELVPKMATHIANHMFAAMSDAKKKEDEAGTRRGSKRASLFRRGLSEEYEDEYQRPRRDDDSDENGNKPFWLIRNNYHIHGPSLLQQRMTVPRTPLQKKWQIPASRTGKCKVYSQLVEICNDMMSTVKLMFNSYKDGKEQFLKRKTELELGVKTTTADLEKQADIPELKKRLSDIEIKIKTVNAGVSQWKMNCKADQEDQNNIAIQEWVSTMEERIRKLGGQGVERFLSNLFRAFEGMFLGTDTPKNNAEEVLNTLQDIREISATFHDIFNNNDITLEKANSHADIILGQLKLIKNTKIFCDK